MDTGVRNAYAIWFSRLDDAVFIEEFTVGYQGEVRKMKEARGKFVTNPSMVTIEYLICSSYTLP